MAGPPLDFTNRVARVFRIGAENPQAAGLRPIRAAPRIMRLIIVSNRLPFTLSFREGVPEFDVSSGGLTTGLWSYLTGTRRSAERMELVRAAVGCLQVVKARRPDVEPALWNPGLKNGA